MEHQRRASDHPAAIDADEESTSAHEVMFSEEAAHQGSVLVLISVCGAIGAVPAWFGLPDPRQRVLVTGICLSFAVFGVLAVLLARRFRIGADAIYSFMTITGAVVLLVLLYQGLYQGISVIAALGVYLAGTQDRVQAWLVWIFLAVYLAIAFGVGVGHIGIERMPLVSNPDQQAFGMALLFNWVLLVAAYLLSRRNRRTTRTAMDQLATLREREARATALLVEARDEIKKLRVAGKVGRYSGEELGGYTMLDVIGRGSMGEVYRAEQVGSGEPVAVKVLQPEVAADERLLKRFFREAAVMGSLDCKHVVKLHSHGVTSEGVAYLAMERLDGQDLAELLADRHQLTLREVVDLVSQVSIGLEAGEDQKIVHRDLKPQNLFLANRPGGGQVWKILDYGSARVGRAASKLTAAVTLGTPSYMSPEQAQGFDLDARSDVFSLGAIIYRALVGRPAFSTGNPAATMALVVEAQPAPPPKSVGLPMDVERVMLLALAKHPDERFRDAADLASAFREAARGKLEDWLRQRADSLHGRMPWNPTARESLPPAPLSSSIPPPERGTP